MAALKSALIDLSEGRSKSALATGPDGAAGPDRGLTITRGRELAARVSELSDALEVCLFHVVGRLWSMWGGGKERGYLNFFIDGQDGRFMIAYDDGFVSCGRP